MLLGTVLLWALNITVTKYMFDNGWQPLAYATIRYFAAIALFWVFTYRRERSFRIARRDVPLVLLAAALIFANQVCFVYGVKLAHASTVALLLGATPVFIGLISVVFRLETLSSAFWIGAALTFAGVALVAAGSGNTVGSSLAGDGLALLTAFSWAAYTVSIRPLMRRYTPYRISALVLVIGWVPLAVLSASQLSSQQFSFGWKVWLGFGYAVIGPLFLTNILWFTSISRVGPSRASLFSNLQPFFAVFFALILLGRTCTASSSPVACSSSPGSRTTGCARGRRSTSRPRSEHPARLGHPSGARRGAVPRRRARVAVRPDAGRPRGDRRRRRLRGRVGGDRGGARTRRLSPSRDPPAAAGDDRRLGARTGGGAGAADRPHGRR
jgi:drug/metabolite transporter (DMT)-like permease